VAEHREIEDDQGIHARGSLEGDKEQELLLGLATELEQDARSLVNSIVKRQASWYAGTAIVRLLGATALLSVFSYGVAEASENLPLRVFALRVALMIALAASSG
jgi:hypothetical protein